MSIPRVLPDGRRGRYLLWLGLGFPVLGIVGFVGQLALKRLFVPWYMPALATFGLVLIAAALWERRNVWRGLALLAVVPLAGAEWAVLYAMRLPSYTGPLAAGRPFPAFQATRADGTPFTQNDLTGTWGHVLVFFRGRW